MNALTIHSSAVELSGQIMTGMRMDRGQTKRLLRELEKIGGNLAGGEIMISQLHVVLARNDWLVISVAAKDAETLRVSGFQIGIVQPKQLIKSKRLSPMQKFQLKNGLRR